MRGTIFGSVLGVRLLVDATLTHLPDRLASSRGFRYDVPVDRIAHKSRSFKDAEDWDVDQQIRMTPRERWAIARLLKDRVYGRITKDVRACHRLTSEARLRPVAMALPPVLWCPSSDPRSGRYAASFNTPLKIGYTRTSRSITDCK